VWSPTQTGSVPQLPSPHWPRAPRTHSQILRPQTPCLRTPRNSGQALIEWLGVLVIVAVMIAGGIKLGLGATVGHHVRQAVCAVLQTRCDGGTTRTNPGHAPVRGPGTVTTVGVDEEHPPSGPPINSGTGIPILPFNGATVSYCHQPSGSNGDDGDPGDTGEGGDGDGGEEGANGTFSVKVCDTITDSRGDPTLTPLCTETQELSVSSDLSVEVKGEVEKDGTGASVTQGAGQDVDYQLNVTPSQVSAMQSGSMGQPNPLDPRSLPTNDSIVLDQDTYNSLDLGASYHGIEASLGYTSGHQVSTGIQSLGNGEMQIDVGDSDLVENALELSVGNDDLSADVGESQTATDGKLKQVDVDVNTPAGWQTYQNFLHTGTLPSDSDAGVSNPASSLVLNYDQEVKAEVNLFGLSAGFSSNPNSMSYAETKAQDGSTTNAFSYRVGDVTEVVNGAANADGVRQTTGYQLLLSHVAPSEVNGFDQIFGGGGQLNANDDAILSFSAAQLDQLQDDAVDTIAYNDKGNKEYNTPAKVRAALAQNPNANVPGETSPGFSLQALATAKGPVGVLSDLQAGSHLGDSSTLLDNLNTFALETLRGSGQTRNTLLEHPPVSIHDCGAKS
jgi:hypothetical protein